MEARGSGFTPEAWDRIDAGSPAQLYDAPQTKSRTAGHPKRTAIGKLMTAAHTSNMMGLKRDLAEVICVPAEWLA